MNLSTLRTARRLAPSTMVALLLVSVSVQSAPDSPDAQSPDNSSAEDTGDKASKQKKKSKDAAGAFKESDAPKAPFSKEEMEAWQKSAAPGKGHKVLQPLVGQWQVAGRFWMVPGAPPMESKGTARVRWVLGKRFIQETFRGESFGMAFSGQGMTGYNNVTKRYESVWMDSMSTGLYTSHGEYDEEKKTLTFLSSFVDPKSGKPKKSRMTIRIDSRKSFFVEMFDLDGEKATKMMELSYTRKAGGKGKEAGKKKDAGKKRGKKKATEDTNSN